MGVFPGQQRKGDVNEVLVAIGDLHGQDWKNLQAGGCGRIEHAARPTVRERIHAAAGTAAEIQHGKQPATAQPAAARERPAFVPAPTAGPGKPSLAGPGAPQGQPLLLTKADGETGTGPETNECQLERSLRIARAAYNESFEPEQCIFYPQPVIWIMGGGPSLKTFDAGLLRKRFVIGCNDAYRFGSDIVNMICFGDYCWWVGDSGKRDKDGNVITHGQLVRETYDGMVVTTADMAREDPRVRWIKRRGSGMYRTGGVGFNTNTGAMAVNVALRLGAKVVILLGFDMGLAKSREGAESNWHKNLVSPPKESSYARFKNGFQFVANDLATKFPGRVVLNANLDSKLECFPKIALEQALEIY